MAQLDGTVNGQVLKVEYYSDRLIKHQECKPECQRWGKWPYLITPIKSVLILDWFSRKLELLRTTFSQNIDND